MIISNSYELTQNSNIILNWESGIDAIDLQFHVTRNNIISYSIRSGFLNLEHTNNGTGRPLPNFHILEFVKKDEESFKHYCSSCYGYEALSGDFPEFKHKDGHAAYSIIEKIFSDIEKKYRKFKNSNITLIELEKT